MFSKLVEEIRSRLVWRKEEGWLPSAGSGGSLPFSWVAMSLAALLREYPGGVTLPLAVADLQRRWNEKNHVWGRNFDGRTCGIGLAHQNESIPFHGILEVQGKKQRKLDQGQLVLELADWRGGRVEWYAPQKFSHWVDCGAVAEDTLFRLTGLRCMKTGRKHVIRLLPTDLFTVLVPALEDLEKLKAKLQDSGSVMHAQVLSVHERQYVFSERGRNEAVVELEVMTSSGSSRARMLFVEEQTPLAQLVKALDVVVIHEPLVGRVCADGTPLVEYGAKTTVFQFSFDPLSSEESLGMQNLKRLKSKHVIDNLARLDRVRLCDLNCPSKNSTLILRVREVHAAKEHPTDKERCVVLDVEDESVRESALLYCWNESCLAVAASLKSGQWMIACNVKCRESLSIKNGFRFELSGESGGRIVPLPFLGWVASPDLWKPSHIADLNERRASAIVPNVLVTQTKVIQKQVHELCGNVWSLRGDRCVFCGYLNPASCVMSHVELQLDDGLDCINVECSNDCAAQFAGRLEGLVGTRWNVFVSAYRAGEELKFRVEGAVPFHSSQMRMFGLLSCDGEKLENGNGI